MRSALRVLFVTASIAIAFGATQRSVAQMSGPMSSGKPPEPAAAAQSASDSKGGDFDVQKLFANTCGWCHSDGGRAPGKGPQLMGTTLSDAEIIHRIKAGKPGAMPAFASSFTDDQLQAIVRYIRSLHE
ncbi:MAG TPA: cytochrome c [Casimicrobiaceae bacterium]